MNKIIFHYSSRFKLMRRWIFSSKIVHKYSLVPSGEPIRNLRWWMWQHGSKSFFVPANFRISARNTRISQLWILGPHNTHTNTQGCRAFEISNQVNLFFANCPKTQSEIIVAIVSKFNNVRANDWIPCRSWHPTTLLSVCVCVPASKCSLVYNTAQINLKRHTIFKRRK